MSCPHAIHGNHCGHLTGAGTTVASGTSGFRGAVCCWCGEEIAVPWTSRREPVPGHGPHRTVIVATDEWPHHWEPTP